MRIFQRFLHLFLPFFFNLLYHQFVFLYDWVAAIVSLGRWRSWVLSTLDFLPGPRVLELGHGPGHLQIALHDRGIRAFGIDESIQMSRLASKRLRRSGIQTHLVNGYSQQSPFNDHAFDQIIATFPSAFIAHPQTAREIKRLLKHEGQLVILPAARIDGGRFLERLAGWLFRVTGINRDLSDAITEPYHQAGFKTEVLQKSDGASTLIIIIANPAK